MKRNFASLKTYYKICTQLTSEHINTFGYMYSF